MLLLLLDPSSYVLIFVQNTADGRATVFKVTWELASWQADNMKAPSLHGYPAHGRPQRSAHQKVP